MLHRLTFLHAWTNRCNKGLLGDDDADTDLATLEKKLTEKVQQSRQTSQAPSNPTSPSQATHDDMDSTPQSSLTSPEPTRDREHRRDSTQPERGQGEEVEALSEMMCSLVTTQNGETRYIGMTAYTGTCNIN